MALLVLDQPLPFHPANFGNREHWQGFGWRRTCGDRRSRLLPALNFELVLKRRVDFGDSLPSLFQVACPKTASCMLPPKATTASFVRYTHADFVRLGARP